MEVDCRRGAISGRCVEDENELVLLMLLFNKGLLVLQAWAGLTLADGTTLLLLPVAVLANIGLFDIV